MVRRQIQYSTYTVVLEGSNGNSAQAERNCLQQYVLCGVADFQVDIAGGSCRTIALLGSAEDCSEYDGGRCLRNECLVKRSVAKALAEVADSKALQYMISRDVVEESVLSYQV
jgi:hypothetical protein